MPAHLHSRVMLAALLGAALVPLTTRAGERAGPPPGWLIGGTAPNLYSAAMVDHGPCGGGRAAVLRGTAPNERGFGTLMQLFDAGAYRGQRLRLSAAVQTRDVKGWAGLWMRVDGPDPDKPLAFDNMQERALIGTTACRRHEVVLDVGQEATRIAMGLLLSGTGEAWLQELRFDVVDSSVATTDLLGAPPPSLPPAPVNLELGGPVSRPSITGRVGRFWFNDGTVAGILHRKPDGSFTARGGDLAVSAEGNSVRVKSGAFSGELTVERQDGQTLITGTWGSWVKYPVRIEYGRKQVSMKWGFYERVLAREDGPQTPQDCADYTRTDGGLTVMDQLQLCGEVLSEKPPPAQTVISFLWVGFRRLSVLPDPAYPDYTIRETPPRPIR